MNSSNASLLEKLLGLSHRALEWAYPIAILLAGLISIGLTFAPPPESGTYCSVAERIRLVSRSESCAAHSSETAPNSASPFIRLN